MRTWIKICGLTHAADAHLAAELGADALGFVFHGRSPRSCALDSARAIIRSLPCPIRTVGVWLDESADEVLKSARYVGCHLVQCYVPETALALRAAGVDVLPAIAADTDSRQLASWLRCFRSGSGRILLDRTRTRVRGGPSFTRESTVRALLSMAAERMVLAGRLTPETVRSALQAFRPGGVDVASGVESEPGRKSSRRMSDFIREVREWDAMVASGVLADSSSPKR